MTQHITLWQSPEFETSTKERTFALPTPPSVLGCCRVRAASVDIAIRFSPDIASGNSIAMGPANDDVKKSATAAGKSPNGTIYTACVATHRLPGAKGRRVFARSFDLGMCSPDAIWKDFNALMSDHIYKKIELVGSSPNGIEDAVNNAISRAGKTIRNMSWFEVAEVRGSLENNKVAHWQVTVKVGFTLDS